MDHLNAAPNPEEDLKYAHTMLARMAPDELLCATYAMEDILDGAVYVTDDMPRENEEISPEEAASAARGRDDLAAGRFCTVEQLTQELGFTLDQIERPSAALSASGKR